MCEADLEKAMSSLDTYRHDLKDRDAKLHHVTSELRTQCAEREHLQEIISNNQHSQERLCQEFDFRMFSLRVSLMAIIVEHHVAYLASLIDYYNKFEGGKWTVEGI